MVVEGIESAVVRAGILHEVELRAGFQALADLLADAAVPVEFEAMRIFHGRIV